MWLYEYFLFTSFFVFRGFIFVFCCFVLFFSIVFAFLFFVFFMIFRFCCVFVVFLFFTASGLVGRVFVNGPGDLGSIPGRIIPKTLKMVLDTSLLSNIRYVSRVKWSNPGKGVAPSPIPMCSSYWKGSLLVALDYGRQLYLTLLKTLNLQQPSTSHLGLLTWKIPENVKCCNLLFNRFRSNSLQHCIDNFKYIKKQ